MGQQSLFHRDITWENEAHAIGVRWKGFTPHLLCVRQGDRESIGQEEEILDLTFRDTLELEISNERSCTGRWEDRQHIPCPTSARISRFHQCDSCSEDRIPDQRCIFEPRCRGDSCLVDGHHGEHIEFCSRPHTVYLAFYGGRMKIGMTATERIPQRIIEQGADAFITLAHTENRYDARSCEKELGRAHSLRQSYSNFEVLRMTTSVPDRSHIQKLSRETIAAILTSNTRSIKAGELTFLDDFPLSLPLRSVPRETTTSGLHMGKKVGIKGRFVYYESSGLRALNLGDIPSRRIRFNAMFGE